MEQNITENTAPAITENAPIFLEAGENFSAENTTDVPAVEVENVIRNPRIETEPELQPGSDIVNQMAVTTDNEPAPGGDNSPGQVTGQNPPEIAQEPAAVTAEVIPPASLKIDPVAIILILVAVFLLAYAAIRMTKGGAK